MILTIYIVILSYFILGGIGFYFINKKKDRESARNNRRKYISYFIIIHVLFLSIVFDPLVFHYLAILIILTGAGEMIYLLKKAGLQHKFFFSVSVLVFILFSAGFFLFSKFDRYTILFSFLILSIFDAFSQISGQLMGKRKILPRISPGKTLEGLSGGAVIAILSSLLLKSMMEVNAVKALTIAAGIVIFAFMGDMLCSLYKRKFGVKDFSRLLPGQGGFLDRFDSLIAGGAFVALVNLTGFLF